MNQLYNIKKIIITKIFIFKINIFVLLNNECTVQLYAPLFIAVHLIHKISTLINSNIGYTV
jgi:hypothetical protein